MGIDAHIVMEIKVGKKWAMLTDQSVAGWLEEMTTISYHTMPHNGLMEAHLLGAFEVMDEGNAPDFIKSHLYRIGDPHRGLPGDMSPATAKATAAINRGHASWVTLKEMLEFDWTECKSHKFWINGPMLEKWKGHLIMPPQYKTHYHTKTGAPDDSGFFTNVSMDVLKQTVDKAKRQAHGSINYKLACNESDPDADARRTKIINDYVTQATSRMWTIVERAVPLYVMCPELVGRIMPQLLRGGHPNRARLICWVI